MAFTDSVHGLRPRILKKSTLNHLVKSSINFVKSNAPLSEFQDDHSQLGENYHLKFSLVNYLSAGHDLY